MLCVHKYIFSISNLIWLTQIYKPIFLREIQENSINSLQTLLQVYYLLLSDCLRGKTCQSAGRRGLWVYENILPGVYVRNYPFIKSQHAAFLFSLSLSSGTLPNIVKPQYNGPVTGRICKLALCVLNITLCHWPKYVVEVNSIICTKTFM